MNRLVIVLIIFVCCSSCTNKLGIGLYDISSQKILYLESKGNREFILNASVEGCKFYTWQPLEKNVVLRERDCLGDELKNYRYSSLNEFYRFKYRNVFFASRYDLIYLENNILWLNDFRVSDQKELLRDVDEVYRPIHFLDYISDSQVLSVLKFQSDESCEFYSIVTIDKEKNKYDIVYDRLIPSIYAQGMYAFSRGNRLFAFFQSNGESRIYGDIVIFDLKAKKVVHTIKSKDNVLFGNLSWNTDGTVLGYVENNNIKVFYLDSFEVKEIKNVDPSKTIHYLGFVSKDEIFYLIDDALHKYSLRSLDIKSGLVNILLFSEFNGKIILTRDASKIIFEYGY